MLRRMLERKRVDGALSQRPSFNIEEVLNEQPDRQSTLRSILP